MSINQTSPLQFSSRNTHLYNERMARGWESKSVEEQQAEAAAQKHSAKSKITPQEAIRLRTEEGLRLSRQRVLQQLGNVRDQRLLQMLEQALADLDCRIKALKSNNPYPPQESS